MDGSILPFKLIDNYINLEKEIQKRTNQISKRYCIQCNTTCCSEEICRESVDSAFLSLLVERQGVKYDEHFGWLSPNGCKLNYGRPYVCYQYFCDKFEKDEIYKASNIRLLVKEFLSIGNRVYEGAHLISIEDLQRIPDAKINKMNFRIIKLLESLKNDI
jgi:hypothetical protein